MNYRTKLAAIAAADAFNKIHTKEAGLKDWFQRTSPLHDAYNAHAERLLTKAVGTPLEGLAHKANSSLGNLMRADNVVSQRLGLYRRPDLTKRHPDLTKRTMEVLEDADVPERIRELQRIRNAGG
jgi:hypothetical protein